MTRSILAVMLALFAAPTVAQEPLRNVTVRFAPDATTQELAGHIVEYEAVDYHVTLRAGQRLDVRLTSSNLSNCFDIYAPGAGKPFYEGGVSGNHHALTAAADGVYRIRVYLLRLAARDGQTAEYALTLARPGS